MVTNWYWNKGPKYPPQPPENCIKGKKCNDLNGNGVCDDGEPGIPGWKITLYKNYCRGWYKVGETTTDENGNYKFCNICGGDYKIVEEDRDGWTHTGPVSGILYVTHSSYNTELGKNFANKQTGQKGRIIIQKAGKDCAFPPSGMVGWWPGDGNANDLADAHNGNLLAGAAIDAGKVGQAFKLDGSTGAVQIPDPNSNLGGFDKLTIDAWVNPDRLTGTDNPGLQTFVAKYDYSKANGMSYWLGMMPGGKLYFVIHTSNEPSPGAWGGVYWSTNNPVLTINQWQHVAAVWDGGETAHLYVDGTEITDLTKSSQNLGPHASENSVPVSIGRTESWGAGPVWYYDGLIDEVEIFNRALIKDEVTAIYQSGSKGKCKPGADVFSFQGSLNGFTLNLGKSRTFSDLTSGSYTVTENPPPTGWALDSIVCQDPTGNSVGAGSSANIILDGTETVTCTFVNKKEIQPVRFTLRKNVLLYWEGQNIEYSDDRPFEIEVRKDGVLIDTVTVSESQPVVLSLMPGTYTFTEINIPAGFEPAYKPMTVKIPEGGTDWSFINVIHYDLAIDKEGPDCLTPGGKAVYTYRVTNNGPASVAPVVTDEILGTTYSPVFQSGDTDGDGLVDVGETWIYTLEWQVPAGATGPITNTARVKEPNSDHEGWWLGGDSDLSNNQKSLVTDVCPMGTYTLWKEVFLYWQGANVLYSDPDWIPADHPFTYEVKNMDGEVVKTVIVKKGEQTTLILPYGTYVLEENPIPEGYIPAWNNHVDITVPGSGFTLANIITFDLEIAKSVPECIHPGTSEEFTLTVTNQGPASVVPVVTDTVEVNGNSIPLTPVLQSATDTDGDGLVDPGENWIYKVTWNVPAGATEPIVNTATVQETHHGQYEGQWHLGGDRNQGQPHPNSVQVPVEICQCIPGQIDIQKKGDDVVKAGATIHYEYLVTNPGTTPLSDVSVLDDKAGSATYDSGDDGDGLLEHGETWKFKASMTAPPWNGDNARLTNTATAKGMACGAWVTDQASFTLDKFQLRKEVCRYYDWVTCRQYQDPNTPFELTVTKQGSAAGPWTFTFSESAPLNLWLSAGTFDFSEPVKTGYTRFHTSMTKTFPSDEYPGTTWINLINFDLSIDKSGPEQCVQPGSQVTYHYDVSNTGPAAVKVKVTDVINGAPPVEITSYTVKTGDSDEWLETGETWTYSYTWTVPPDAQGQISDTATVEEIDAYRSTGGNWKGGDPTVPNKDTFTITVCQPTVTKSFDLECGPGGFEEDEYVTYTQGWWKHHPSEADFNSVYPSGVEIGIPVGGNSAKFTTVAAMNAYMESTGGPSGPLPPGHSVDPAGPTTEGTFGHQVLALQENVDFSVAGKTGKDLTPIIVTGLTSPLSHFNGMTIGEILAEANNVLGGGALPSGMSYSNFNDMVSLLNENLDEGTPTGWAQQHLIAPCVPSGATAYASLTGTGGPLSTPLTKNGLHYEGSLPGVVKGIYNVRFYYVLSGQTTLCTINDENIQHSLTNYCLWPVS
jgi:hypothetical protein